MFDFAIELARKNQAQIAETASKLIIEAGVSETITPNKNEVLPNVTRTLGKHLDYIQSGDIEGWRIACVALVESRLSIGADYVGLIRANQIVLQTLGRFFQQTLPKYELIEGKPSAKVLQRIEARLNSLDATANMTATATAMRLKHKPLP